MNKLISKSPILRFKLGRKIVKAQFGYSVRNDGVIVNRMGVPVGSVNGGYFATPIPTATLNAPLQPIANGTYYETKDSTGKVIDKGRYFGGKKHSLPLGNNSQKDQALLLNIVQQQKKLVVKPTLKKNWTNEYNNFVNNLSTALKAWLTNQGVKYDDVADMLSFLKNKLGSNSLGKWGVDKKWGNASQAAWNKLASQTDFTPNNNIDTNPILFTPTVKIPTTESMGNPKIPVLSTRPFYTKSMIRDFIRSKGKGAYDFSGSLRKALRMVLNNNASDEDLATVKAMGLFKLGGKFNKN